MISDAIVWAPRSDRDPGSPSLAMALVLPDGLRAAGWDASAVPMFAYGGTTINGQPSQPWSQAPQSDAERF